MLGAFITLLYTIQCQTSTIVDLHDGKPPLDGQTLPESQQKIAISEEKKLPTGGCRSVTKGHP